MGRHSLVRLAAESGAPRVLGNAWFRVVRDQVSMRSGVDGQTASSTDEAAGGGGR